MSIWPQTGLKIEPEASRRGPSCHIGHLSRRMLLKGSLASAAGASVLNWGGLAQSADNVEQTKKKSKRCILLWMNGGASQFETFDMKPQSRFGGPFRPISTN